jgi:hypothetical protein
MYPFIEVESAAMRSHFLRQLDLGQSDLASIRQTSRTIIKPILSRSLSHYRISEITYAETLLH